MNRTINIRNSYLFSKKSYLTTETTKRKYVYKDRFQYKTATEIHNYVENLWSDQNISSEHQSLKPFIKRNHLQIVEECASEIEGCNKNVLTIWNKFQQNKSNSTKVFNLKLHSVGGNVEHNHTSHFVVTFNPKIENHEHKTRMLNNNKSKDNAQFLCQCIFKKWNVCHILKIINDNKYKLECKYLNDDIKKEYSVIKITNAYHIFTSDSETEKNEYIQHIRSCEWIKTTAFSLFLYKIQMEHTKKFLTNIMSMNNMSQIEEMKASQMNECNTNNSNNNSNNNTLKRKLNDTMNDIETNNCINDNDEPLLKRRKVSNYVPVITDDDYHIKIETPGADNNNQNIEARIMSISQQEGDEDIDLNHIKCKVEQNINIINEQEDMPFFNWEADIERDYNNTQSNDIQLDLTAIQSIILCKSAQNCQGSLKLNHEHYVIHKNNMIQCITEIGKEYFEWDEPNESQYNAICKSTLSPVSLIHGPPGTGKTSTCAQLINGIIKNDNLLKTNKKIFVCAYTHNAINELLGKISVYLPEYYILRLGDKDRCTKKYKKYCLEKRIEEYKPRNQSEKEAALQNIFHSSVVIIGTVYSARCSELMWFMDKNDNKVFDYLLIDECTQILDPVLTIVVNILDQTSDNTHLILVGDHKQLPPVIKSDKIKQSGYKTVFETLVEEIDNKHTAGYYQMLQMQYRMPECLIQFSNKEWYDNKIISYQKHVDWNDDILNYINDMIMNKIRILQNVIVYNKNDIPIYIIQLPNGGEQKQNNTSWKNEQEARFICQYILEELIQNASISIGIVSFYKSQATHIDCLMTKIGIKKKCCDIMSQTAHAFQGKEKDVIVLSLVRNVIEGTKFNNNAKLINVALTRCKKAVIVVTSFDVSKAHIGYSNGSNNIWKRFFKRVVNNNSNINQSNQSQINMMNSNNDFNCENRNNRIQINNVRPVIRDENQQEVWDFLSRIKFTEYFNIFVDNGFDRIAAVKCITIDDLTKMGIVKLGHQKLITREAKKEMGVIL